LHGAKTIIAEHMSHRQGHFMPLGLLDSQFETLEEPQPEERAIVVEITDSIEQSVEQATIEVQSALEQAKRLSNAP
jgi:gluconate kinase